MANEEVVEVKPTEDAAAVAEVKPEESAAAPVEDDKKKPEEMEVEVKVEESLPDGVKEALAEGKTTVTRFVDLSLYSEAIGNNIEVDSLFKIIYFNLLTMRCHEQAGRHRRAIVCRKHRELKFSRSPSL